MSSSSDFGGSYRLCGVRLSVPPGYDPSRDDKLRTYSLSLTVSGDCLDENDGYELRVAYRQGLNSESNFGDPVPGCQFAFADETCGSPSESSGGEFVGPFAVTLVGRVLGDFFDFEMPDRDLLPFVPRFPRSTGDKNDQPGLRSSEQPATETELSAYVGDNCGYPLPRTEVTFESFVDPELQLTGYDPTPPAAGHLHFANSMSRSPGTGTFVPSTVTPGIASPARLAGLANQDGLFFARYRGGEYGVGESMVLRARDPATNVVYDARFDQPLVIGFGILSGAIVPDFSQLESEGPDTNVTYAGTASDCDLGHNASRTGSALRYTRAVAGDASNSIRVMANLFYRATSTPSSDGIKLSLNDASLPLGGVIDSASDSTTAPCHATHRTGVDIDVNGGAGPCSGYNLNCPMGTADPRHPDGETRIDFLTRLVEESVGGRRMLEGNRIHFRFLEPQPE